MRVITYHYPTHASLMVGLGFKPGYIGSFTPYKLTASKIVDSLGDELDIFHAEDTPPIMRMQVRGLKIIEDHPNIHAYPTTRRWLRAKPDSVGLTRGVLVDGMTTLYARPGRENEATPLATPLRTLLYASTTDTGFMDNIHTEAGYRYGDVLSVEVQLPDAIMNGGLASLLEH